MEQIFNDSGLSMEFDRETKILYRVLKGRIKEKVARDLLDAEIEFAKNNQILATFTDAREQTGTFTMVNNKIAQEVVPILVKSGVICTAMVVSRDVFGEFAAKDLLKKVDQFEFQIFQDYDEAIAFVKSRLGIE